MTSDLPPPIPPLEVRARAVIDALKGGEVDAYAAAVLDELYAAYLASLGRDGRKQSAVVHQKAAL